MVNTILVFPTPDLKHFNLRPNPLQYFLVPDIEVENGAEEEDLEDEDDDVDDVVEEEEGDGVEEEEEAEDDDEK